MPGRHDCRGKEDSWLHWRLLGSSAPPPQKLNQTRSVKVADTVPLSCPADTNSPLVVRVGADLSGTQLADVCSRCVAEIMHIDSFCGIATRAGGQVLAARAPTGWQPRHKSARHVVSTCTMDTEPQRAALACSPSGSTHCHMPRSAGRGRGYARKGAAGSRGGNWLQQRGPADWQGTFHPQKTKASPGHGRAGRAGQTPANLEPQRCVPRDARRSRAAFTLRPAAGGREV